MLRITLLLEAIYISLVFIELSQNIVLRIRSRVTYIDFESLSLRLKLTNIVHKYLSLIGFRSPTCTNLIFIGFGCLEITF